MKKIRSKNLWQYLYNSGVLNGTLEDITNAKREYLRLYKKQWKLNRIPKKEMRPAFTLQEYQTIKLKAHEACLHPTVYVKQTVIARLTGKLNVADKETLLLALQQLSIAITASKNILPKYSLQQLLFAEKLLLEYIGKI